MNTDYTLGLVLLISGSRRSILYVRVHFKFLFIEIKKKSNFETNNETATISTQHRQDWYTLRPDRDKKRRY